MDKNNWVVIPVNNEEENIPKVLREVKKYTNNLVVVDDGSSDDTCYVVKKEKVTLLRHLTNLGKGSALKTGCDYAVKNGARKIVVMDGDGQHNPKEIPLFFKDLDHYDIVFGYRKFTGDMPILYRLGNGFINFVSKMLYGIDLKDTQCGYRAFTSEAYKRIKWESQNYSMESEMIANTGKKGLKHKERRIETIYSEKYKGTTPFDGVKIVFDMFLWRFKK